MAEAKAPSPAKTPTTELVGAEADERPAGKPYQPKKGWVEDAQGRHHEVDDAARFLEAYPGSKALKADDVVKARIGYEDAPAAEAAAQG